MRFLLDTDICSAHMRRPGKLAHRFVQHTGHVECAEKFGQVRGTLLQQGISVPTTDLMIASVALVHDLTLVTHNTADFHAIPGLLVEDWPKP